MSAKCRPFCHGFYVLKVHWPPLFQALITISRFPYQTRCLNWWSILEIPSYIRGNLLIKGRINALRPKQNDRHFADDIFKYIFLNEKCLSIQFSPKFPKCPTDNKSSLVQVMTWCHQAPSHFMNQCCATTTQYSVTNLNELTLIATSILGEISSVISRYLLLVYNW